MSADKVKGHLDLLLLAVLGAEPGHGYAVITRLRDRTDGLLDLTEGAVYPALHRLEDLGYLASEWYPVNGRRRRLYRLTSSGHSALARQRTEWQSLARAISSVVGPALAGTAEA